VAAWSEKIPRAKQKMGLFKNEVLHPFQTGRGVSNGYNSLNTKFVRK
jgi:hypothetical protein